MPAGLITLEEASQLHADAKAAVAYLTSAGVECWMATGDNATAAEQVAASAGIPLSRVLSEQTPASKLALVEKLKAEGRTVAMVGDGVNDAPALAYADVGIAVSSALDVAMEAADIVLMKPSIAHVCIALDLCRATLRRIRINFVWAMIYNACAIPVAAGVFYPWTRWQLPPELAGLAMVLSSVSVVCSSLILYCYRPPSL